MASREAPNVAIAETDNTGSIEAQTNTVAAIVLRNTYKGQENTPFLASLDSDVIGEYGYPTDSSYKDILAGIGFLQDSPYLYCTRVMPPSAAYAGTKITSGYTVSSRTNSITASERSSLSLDTPTFANKSFADNTIPFGTNDFAWLIASSRGAWGNDVRVLLVDRQFYDSVRYFDTTTQKPVYPYGYATTSYTNSASALALASYNAYLAYTAGTSAEDYGTVYPTVRNLNSVINSEDDFIVVVQAIEQGTSNWSTVETWNVSIDVSATDDVGRTKFAESVINARSAYIRIALNTSIKITTDLSAAQIAARNANCAIYQWARLQSGTNSTWGTGEEAAACINAYSLFAAPENYEINLFLDGDKTETVKSYLGDLAENTRKDCMAIIDPPLAAVMSTTPATDLVKWRRGTSGSNFNPSSSYMAIYGNWVEVYDKWNKKYRWIPACGHVAGVFARTDSSTYPWFAPSGYNRGILRNVRRVACNLDQTNRNIIFNAGINPIINVESVGKIVLGQTTTLDKTSAFRDINVRRLFLTIEKSIAKRALYYLEEPNDETTRLRFVNEVLPYLRSVKTNRGIDSFSIICDTTNNTSTIIENNQMICDIYVQPTRTASKIKLNFIGIRGSGTTVSESETSISSE